MPPDLDRYYTPENVAIKILEMADIPLAAKIFADSTCGSGRLLDAACRIIGSAECIGIDRDKSAISRLRLRRPSWHLAVANLLGNKQRIMRFSNQLPNPVDLLVLNPPFSHGEKKSTKIYYDGVEIKATVSMAHLLRSLDLFKPKHGAIAIVPESFLYSDTDEVARNKLQEKYHLKKIVDLQRCTFRGARVNSSAIQLHQTSLIDSQKETSLSWTFIEAAVVRGCLPVHLMRPEYPGTPFLHSTDIRKLVSDFKFETLPTTISFAKGRVSGWSILIPRVGLPNKDLLSITHLDRIVQLSDCVIALIFDSQNSAVIARQRLIFEWNGFYELYKGTGARYITISRLTEWLMTKGIVARA
jgi:predicted RNA methylase